ncbi:MAG: class E sortase [Gaiellales bacterium]
MPIAQERLITYSDLARVVGTGLLSTGIGLLVFVAITVVWGDPFTRLSEQAEQKQLFAEFETVAPDPETLANASLDAELTRLQAVASKRSVKLGSPAGQISIPAIKVTKIFVHGARDDTPDLSKGPGLYQNTPFPGTGAPLAIAGHRTTHGAPFLDLDRLDLGDRILLTVPYGKFTYTVTRTAIVGTRAWSILQYGAAERASRSRSNFRATRNCGATCEHLVLTACHPKWSSDERIAVFARLTKVQLAA